MYVLSIKGFNSKTINFNKESDLEPYFSSPLFFHSFWFELFFLNNSIGFDSEYNEVSIFYKNKKFTNEKITKRKKSEIAEEITNRIINQLN